MRNVGHIGRLVISSEESIAKGIRRIVALTGPEAENAFQRANRVEERVNKLFDRVKQNPDVVRDQERSKALMKEINEMTNELNSMVLPYWRKNQLISITKEAQKTLDTFGRNAMAQITNKVLEQAKQFCQNTNGHFAIYQFEKGANTKVSKISLFVDFYPLLGSRQCHKAIQESKSRYGGFSKRRFSKIHCYG